MTAHAVKLFRGEVPLLAPQELPDNAAQAAVNARLYTGDLTAFRQFSVEHGLANTGPVRTIFLLKDWWLSWNQQVDVARGTIPGDTTYRTYITGLDVPRFTNLDLATGVPNGSAPEPYPWQTRVVGVSPPDSPPTLAVGVDPTPTSFSVDVYDDCSDLATNWILSPGQASNSSVTQDDVFGNPAPSFKLVAENNTSNPAYAYRDFGTAGASVIHASWDVNLVDLSGTDSILMYSMFACGAAGDGARVYVGKKLSDPINIGISLGSDFSAGNGSSIAFGVGGAADFDEDVWYTVDVVMVSNGDGTATITAGVYLGSAKLAEVTTTNIFTIGGIFGPIHGKGSDRLEENFDNFLIQASGSLNNTITNIATSYVYTFVNDLGEESAPSLPSNTVLRPDGVSVTVTTPGFVPSGISGDQFITTKRIYRAATGSTGTFFRFVAEIPLAQEDYVDVLTDAQLGEVLQSELWAPPPSDLQGILALPNGVMVGFRRNQLCLSAQNQPHAWPVEYRLNTDTDIVGIANIDTTVIIGTQSFLYVASGNDPAQYSMGKSEVPYAASSKLSFDYITGLGVVFSGPDGLMSCLGIGQVRNLTEKVFTRDQWQALGPESIASVAHNDIYFAFWDAGSGGRGCYAVDLRSSGFGIVQMAFHASAAYVDPIGDEMYLVLDADNEPDDPSLPVAPTTPHYIDARTIFKFQGSTNLMTYRYRTKLWLENYPSFHSIAQVRRAIGAVGNLLARFYGDGVMLDEIVVDGDVEFTLTPPDAAYDTFEMELLGTDPVRVLQAADDVAELG